MTFFKFGLVLPTPNTKTHAKIHIQVKPVIEYKDRAKNICCLAGAVKAILCAVANFT